jgi:hypothetical protein
MEIGQEASCTLISSWNATWRIVVPLGLLDGLSVREVVSQLLGGGPPHPWPGVLGGFCVLACSQTLGSRLLESYICRGKSDYRVE